MKKNLGKKKLRWGILSTARINRRVIPPINTAARSEVTAVASRDKKRAQQFAARWEIPCAFGSYEELLASPEIDAVYLPLPNSLHREWTVKAAQAGKHVLCEKPLALSAEEVDGMISAARENRVVLLEAVAYRFHTQFAAARRLIATGAIGKVKLIRARYCFTMAEGANFRWQKELGGGSLWDVGVYPVSFARGIMGMPPEEVFSYRRLGPTGVDVLCAGQLNFPGEILAQIECGYCLAYGVGAEVVGDGGTLVLPNPWHPDLDGKRSGVITVAPDDSARPLPTEVIDPFLCEVKAMEDAVFEGLAPAYPPEESRDNVATLAALHESAAAGRPVAVSSASE